VAPAGDAGRYAARNRDMTHRNYYLELCSRGDFRPKPFPESGFSILTAKDGDAERCEFLWKEVGKGFWTERSEWSCAKWIDYLRRDDVAFWLLASGNDDVGFFELTKDSHEVKIEGIGLLPTYRGEGIGGALLSFATEQAYAWHAHRIWLNTATDDHPNALPNYLKRGYQIYRQEELLNPMQIDEPGA
jgi:GNAT superfamily N-acetyltransferase